MSQEKYYLEYDYYHGHYTALGFTYGGFWVGWSGLNPLQGFDPLDEDQPGVCIPYGLCRYKINARRLLRCLIDEMNAKTAKDGKYE